MVFGHSAPHKLRCSLTVTKPAIPYCRYTQPLLVMLKETTSMKNYYKRNIFLALTILIGLTSCKTQNSKRNGQLIRNDYKEKLSILLHELADGKTVDDNLILYSFPQVQEEYLMLYDYDNPDAAQTILDALRKRDMIIDEKIKKGNIEYLKMEIIQSEFVDGYVAEGYFEEIEYYHELNPDNFCKAYKFLEMKYGKEKFKRLNLLKIDCLKN